MDWQSLFLRFSFIIILYSVDPASAYYCYYNSYYYSSLYYYCSTYYYSYYYYYYDYYYSGYSSAGTIAGAVVGSIVGVAIIISIIAALCGACKKTNRLGVVVQPMQTASTVVATNSSQMQYQPMYNQYNQYPQPGGAPYLPLQQNMAYPPPVAVPAPAFNNQPPAFEGLKPVYA